MQNTLKGKGNKTKLVEGALNELTKEHIENLSKEEIASILDKCRSVSLWDRFLGKYKKFQNFKEKMMNYSRIEIQ